MIMTQEQLDKLNEVVDKKLRPLNTVERFVFERSKTEELTKNMSSQELAIQIFEVFNEVEGYDANKPVWRTIHILICELADRKDPQRNKKNHE